MKNRKTALLGIAAAFIAGPASAGPGSLAGPLCGVLKGVAPKTRGLEPAAARAQLVRALAAAFDRDAAKLREVRIHIDEATSDACPEDRQRMLDNAQAKTLLEAID